MTVPELYWHQRALEDANRRDRKTKHNGSEVGNGTGDHEPPASSKRIKVIMGSDVKPEAIDWLWPDWLARGKLHIIAGRPGTLKTTAALSLAAAITSGGQWPDGEPATAGVVIIWSGEDAINDTLLPRFIAAG